MKEKIKEIKQIFEEFRDQINCFELSELQQEEWGSKFDKLEDLAEELEFLCEDL